MKAGFGYSVLRTEEGGQGGSRGWGRLGDEETIPPCGVVAGPGIQDAGAADKPGRNSQVQAQSALKVLQHQLESFQALRQQTLQNVNLVQSEINEILNKNIADMKHPELNPDPLLLSSMPISVATPRWCQEALLLKNQLHHDNRTKQCRETSPDNIFGDPVTGGNVPHHILTKCQLFGTAELPVQTPRKNAILAFTNGHELKNSASSTFSPSWVGLETEVKTPFSDIKGYAGSKIPMAFHAGEDEHVAQIVSSSFGNMKEDGKKILRHELPYTFDAPNTSTVLYSKDNDSGYLSEQDLSESVTSMSRDDFKSRKSSDLEDSVDELHIAVVSFKENNQIAAQLDSNSKNQNKDFFVNGNMFENLQLNFYPKTGKDTSLTLEHAQREKKNEQLPLLGTKHEFQKHRDLEFCAIEAGSDSYGKKSRLLQMSPEEPKPLQKTPVDLQSENGDLKKQMKPLTGIIQSLTEQNSKYQKQIKDLHDEKSSIQERLVKSERDCKECIKEVKSLLKKCNELQQQKIALEEKQDELYAQNQRMMRNVDDFQNQHQQAQESVAALTQDKGDLVVALKTLESQISSLREEHKGLEGKVSQLTDEKSLLQKELEEKQKEIQQLKENEKTKLADMEAAQRMTQTLKEEKLNLEKTLRESTDFKEVLEKELEEVRRERVHAEGKLLAECKNTRKENGILKTDLSKTERECERLSAVVKGMTEDNWVLKKELHEYKQDVSECKATIRKLSEELLLMENEIRTMQNERDVLQFEVRRLHRNNGCLRDQVAALFNEQYKKRSNSGSNGDPANPTEICEEMSSFQHISVKYNLPEYGKIAEIRRKLEEEAHHKEKGSCNVRQLSSTVSVSCTTSIITQSGLHSAVRKKYSTLCSAT
ncbi:coiled-coil domain-containing protein 110 [Eublepharis macularius]|uniref:Coiled-coil domain-containing protein 110 n=1 Tax=Eublepharis macularius TaxID=481883 RepID=A0AA97JZW3_EUBMA|nr:coiled-coil domain-containing protein 110 [Eublepharis macularius]